jgi:hypothetical protein
MLLRADDTHARSGFTDSYAHVTLCREWSIQFVYHSADDVTRDEYALHSVLTRPISAAFLRRGTTWQQLMMCHHAESAAIATHVRCSHK